MTTRAGAPGPAPGAATSDEMGAALGLAEKFQGGACLGHILPMLEVKAMAMAGLR